MPGEDGECTECGWIPDDAWDLGSVGYFCRECDLCHVCCRCPPDVPDEDEVLLESLERC